MKRLIITLVIILSAISANAAFIDNGDGTITDTHTNLMWLKDADSCGLFYTTWYMAASCIDGLNNSSFLGYNDWRLPLADITCSVTCPNGELGHLLHIEGIDRDNWGPFTNVLAGYWTGSVIDEIQAWVQMFTPSGAQIPDFMDYPIFAAWAVRDSGSTILMYYCDDDDDGYIDLFIDGNCAGTGCEPQGCQTTPGDDCDDTDAYVNPGATEECNCTDDNCDGSIDEGGVCGLTLSAFSESSTCGPTCTDADGDTYFAPNMSCYPSDCDDTDAEVHMDGKEVRILDNPSNTSSYYWISGLQTAINDAAVGKTIQIKTAAYTGNLDITKIVSIEGGYNCSFYNTTGYATINGNMTISNGTLTINLGILKIGY